MADFEMGIGRNWMFRKFSRKKINMLKKKENLRIVQWIVIVVLFWFLLISYWKNSFHIVEFGWFDNWQVDSERSVWDRIYEDIHFGFMHHAGLLGECKFETTYMYDPEHFVYTAQIGLQGLAFGILSRYLHMTQSQLYFTETLLMILCLAFLAWWIWSEFGYGTAIGYTILLFFNNWLTVSARNLYWVLWTMIFPFLCTLFILRLEEKTGKDVSKRLFLWGFLSIFIRCACGYEFISSVMINLELPVFYYAIKNKWKIKCLIRKFLQLALSAILAFACSVVGVIIQNYFYLNTGVREAINAFLFHVLFRTGVGGTDQYQGMIRDSLEASRLSIVETYLNEGVPLLFGFCMNILIVFVFTGMLLSMIDARYCKEIDEKRRKLLALDAIVCISFCGFLSWLVLAKGHSYIHTHIVYMMWSLPFLLLGEVLVFSSIGSIVISLRRKYKKIFVATVGVAVCFGLVCYYDVHLPALKEYRRVVDAGVTMYQDESDTLVLYEDSLYYFTKQNDGEEYYFLHFYENEQAEEFYNSDFIFADREMKLPFWFREHIAKIEIPKDYGVQMVETGRLEHNDTERAWQKVLSSDALIPSKASFQIVDVSDENWEYGFSRRENMILAYSENAYLSRCVGKSIRINGEKAVITAVKYVDGTYFYVYLDKKIEQRLKNSVARLTA